jgi:DNA-binding NtrC family response regulator
MGQNILGAGSMLFRGRPVLSAARKRERHRAEYRAMKKKTAKARTRILLIGENPDAVLFTALQHEGYEAIECDSPQNARDVVDGFRPHLLFVHLRRPADVATLQECHLLADGIPIVVATSVPGYETVMRALEGGATSFLFLPLEPAKIKKVVDDLLVSHETH